MELSAAQERVVGAALKLFSQHGVGGTSIRMISGELGVTAAAVYHQYHTKDEIVFAAVESQLRRLKEVVDSAETESTPEAARQALINGIVELTMGLGGSMTTVLNDPAVTGSFSHHAGYRALFRRIRLLLVGDDTSKEARIRIATLLAAVNGTASSPLVAHFDDSTRRSELRNLANRLLESIPLEPQPYGEIA